ncbi:MAG TPA: amidohydrolase family protein [Burkholderiales bacterium]|nr:amidohydrolase family protein [Burkholderiales bacterium]
MPMRDDGKPDFKSPPLGCDTHFHVFGPAERYPYGADLRYAPPLAPLGDFLAIATKFGIERFVFVQPSAYGRDNRCMLDAMRVVGKKKCRGIVDIDENAPDAELSRLDALGVRGVRINVPPVKLYEAGFAATLLPRVERLHARCAEIGWQLDFLTPGWLTAELVPTLRKLNLDFTIAHFGLFPAKDGVSQPGFQAMLDLLRHGNGRCWVKLTGVYRMSVAKGFADVAPMAQALIEAAPGRVIWGSDYPHLSFVDKVGSLELWTLLGKWAPDAATRRRILVDNPQRLFKF